MVAMEPRLLQLGARAGHRRLDTDGDAVVPFSSRVDPNGSLKDRAPGAIATRLVATLLPFALTTIAVT